MDDKRVRFPIFKQLSRDNASVSRSLQIVCEFPSAVVPQLSLFGEVRDMQTHSHSVVVEFAAQASAEAAFAELSERHRVFYCSPRVENGTSVRSESRMWMRPMLRQA